MISDVEIGVLTNLWSDKDLRNLKKNAENMVLTYCTSIDVFNNLVYDLLYCDSII